MVLSSPVSAASGSPSTGATAPVTGGDEIFSSESFLKLLAAQIGNQNPLEPLTDTQFVAQMAQFSQLEQMTAVRKGIESLTLGSGLAQAATLIGKTVAYRPAADSAPVTGVVESVSVSGEGRQMTLRVDGHDVDMSSVVGVRA